MKDSYRIDEPILWAQTRIASLQAELKAAEEELARLEFSKAVASWLIQDERVKQLMNEFLTEVDLSLFPNGIPLYMTWNSGLRRLEVDFDSYYARSKDHGLLVPGRDIPNSNSNQRQSRRGRRPRRNVKPPQEEDYYVPILKALKSLGWAAAPDQITPLVLARIRPKLSPEDFELIESRNFIRWECRMRFARYRMVLIKPPLLNPESPRGIWEATDDGRKFLERHDDKNDDDDGDKNWSQPQ